MMSRPGSFVRAALTLCFAASSASGCSQSAGLPQPPIESEPPDVKTVGDPEAQKLAETDFAVALAHYDAAAADGLTQGECHAVVDAFEAVSRKHGSRMRVAQFNAAAVLESCGDVAAATKMYEDLAAKGYHLALNNLGVLAWQRGDSKAAMDYFRRSVAADSKHAFAARNNLAAALRERYSGPAGPDRDLFEKAERQLQNVLAVDSSNQEAYENLARLYYDRGRLVDPSYLLLANLVVSQAVQILGESGKRSADLYNLAGLLRMEEDDQVEALQAFNRAVEVDSTHADAHLNIAFIAIRFRDFSQAEASLAIALVDPGVARNVEAVLAMGVAKRGARKYDEAKTYYLEATKLAQADPRPHYNLGVLEHEHIASRSASVDEQIEIFRSAREHYSKFVSLAGGDKIWAELVDDARGRIYVIDEAIGLIHQHRGTASRIRELEALEKKAADEEHERLLELERRAIEAEQAAEPSGGGPGSLSLPV